MNSKNIGLPKNNNNHLSQTINIKDKIIFGNESFIVLDIVGNDILIISEHILFKKQFNNKFLETSWETSSIRDYLNNDYFSSLSKSEQTKVVEVNNQNHGNPIFNTKHLKPTSDKVFLLSFQEVIKYFGESASVNDLKKIDDEYNELRVASFPDGSNQWWWLRTRGFYGLNTIYVNADGWIYIDGNNVNFFGGVRPCLWIKLHQNKINNDISEDCIQDEILLNGTKDLFNNYPINTFILDLKFNILEGNKAAQNTFLKNNYQKFPVSFFRLTPTIQPNGQNTIKYLKNSFNLALNEDKVVINCFFISNSGEEIYTEVTIKTIKISNKEYFTVYIKDLKDLIYKSQESLDIDEKIKLMLDATPLMCFLWDEGFNLIDCNQEAVRKLGLDTKNHVIETFYRIQPVFQPCGRPSIETLTENLQKAFRDGYFNFEWYFERFDSIVIPCELILVRIKYKDGYIIAGYARDLREYKKILNDLNTALSRATDASNAKSDFLSAMSHEMRTPMNAIIGMSKIGLKSDKKSEKNQALQKINDASIHLLGVINDVLDMAKIEANKLQLSPENVIFNNVINKILSIISYEIENKNQNFSINIDKSIPTRLFLDEQRFMQVITNLVSNAIKFTNIGGNIVLKIDLLEKINNLCRIKVEVIDDGIGISKEQQKRLFKAFEQVESGMGRSYSGTGLGLVISKNIISLMNGSIWVESELGYGSRFIFTFQAIDATQKENKESDDAYPAEMQKNEFIGKRLLLVEDVLINQEIVLAHLEDSGIKIDCAENGEIAYELVKENPLAYDLILMDLQMPVMNGYEATRKIRVTKNVPKDLPIIALTANVFVTDIEACIAAGINDHLGKPLDFSKLLKILRYYLHKGN